MKNVVIALFLMTSIANAKPVKATYFLNGKSVPIAEALSASLDKKEVLKCQPVTVSPNKSGSSLSLKVKQAE